MKNKFRGISVLRTKSITHSGELAVQYFLITEVVGKGIRVDIIRRHLSSNPQQEEEGTEILRQFKDHFLVEKSMAFKLTSLKVMSTWLKQVEESSKKSNVAPRFCYANINNSGSIGIRYTQYK